MSNEIIAGLCLMAIVCALQGRAVADEPRILSAEELIEILGPKKNANPETELDADADANEEFSRGLGGVRQGFSGQAGQQSDSIISPAPTSFADPSTQAAGPAAARQVFHNLFESDSYNLRTDAYRQLDEIGRAIHLIIANYPSATFTIEGHSESFGNEEDDMTVSRNMAVAVANYLVGKLWLDERRIHAVGYGSQRPTAAKILENDTMRDRRIEIVSKNTVR